MFDSAADEMGQWAERCRIWAVGARTGEQRSMLLGLEKILSQAALDTERNLGSDRLAPTKF
jgi:hypothetical protein